VPARIQPQRAERWLAAALASPVSAASTLPAPMTGSSALVTLRGNTRPEANAYNDRGRVADSMPLNHLMLQLQRTPEQEQALEQFIDELHDPASPLFHHWLTAEEFGQTYGVAPGDVAKVTDWLESQGFKVNQVYPSQMTIDFNATAGQIRQAFHTEIHNLMVNGEAHYANMSDPQIPADLGSVVAGPVSLHDFRAHPMFQPRANYTVGSGDYPLVPADLWKIYNFGPAFAEGYSGQGQTIAVIEYSDLFIYGTEDWDTFRSALGLSASYPLGSLTQVHPNCTDPGVNLYDREAALDAEWASAAAPSAKIELASCSGGIFVTLANLLASSTPPAIVSISYGEAETVLGAATNLNINNLYEQAAGQGVSVFVSAGNNGASSNDIYEESYALNGITVNGLASTPYNVAVGGTDFADTYEKENSTYWSSTSNPNNFESALSYVPEIPWNDSCASVLLGDYLKVLPTFGWNGLCNDATYNNLLTTTAGSGGPSACATGGPGFLGFLSPTDYVDAVGGTCVGYAKPVWQSGFVGNPSDGVRDIPDVSLFAGNGTWNHYYVTCFSDLNNGGASCTGAPSTWAGVGGTSVAAPIWAGIQALVNEASGVKWGNPDSKYYSLAATEYGGTGSTTCNSALGNLVAANCIFYDVTQLPLRYFETSGAMGGDNDVPCLGGENCFQYAITYPPPTYGVVSTSPQSITNVWVTGLGGGYTSAPNCTLTGGGGSGASCYAYQTTVVASISATTGGGGYSSNPTCTLTTVDTGSGATCLAYVCGDTSICAYTMTNFGSGYTTAPTCTLTGGGGAGATCTANLAPGFATGIGSGGSGYTTLPRCVISGGGGAGGTCATQASNSSEGYQPAFQAGTGWDFTSGIGTVNVSNLLASMVSISLPSVALSPPNIAFPPQPLGTTSAAKSVTVTNIGSSPLIISTATIGGADPGEFAKTADTCTGATLTPSPASGSTCTVSVTFTPSATGIFSATLDITDSASNSPQTVTLSGGTGVTVSLSFTSITFPDQTPGTSSPAQTLTMINTGSSALTLTSFVITGTNGSDFSQNNTCGSTLAAGANCAINVIFTPGALGSRSAILTITDNAVNTPQTVSLAGKGVNPVPLINQPLVPTSAAPGGSAFTLTVNGTGFDAGAAVNWNGVPLATTWVGGEQLTATVPAANIASPGTAWITVVNGVGLTSNTISFVVTAPTTTATFTNAPSSPVAAQTAPASIVAGDFNGDGILDLAITNFASNSVTILTGNGGGTFTLASTPTTGTWPYGVAVGDFRGIGKLDLAVANTDSDDVTILLGNGNGTFTPAAASPATGVEPYALAVGDFNGDGFLDLAVTNLNSNNVTILLGNGDGTFTPAAASPATGSGPIAIAVGDFNGDGKLDLAVTNVNQNTVTILLGNGDGTFSPVAPFPATGSKPYAVAAGDFNGDGKLDLAVVNFGSNSVTILLGNGDGTFTPASSSPATGNGPYAVAVGDFNGDGKLDLAVANENSNTVTVLLGNGDGTFTPDALSPATGKNPYALAVGDFNGDGRLDLATANHGSNDVSVLIQAPLAGVSTSLLTFGPQNVGSTSTPQAVTLTNTGNPALTITSITPSANFGQTNNCGGSVEAGGSCTINVTFTPTATGPLSGTLTITDNSGGVPGTTQTVNLKGTGVSVPLASVSPSSLAFGNETVPTTSAPLAATLSNTGTAVLTISNVAASTSFAVATGPGACTGSLAAGSSCTIYVTFTPLATGPFSGTLTITDNNNLVAGSTQTVSLSGYGTGVGVVPSLTSLTFPDQTPGTTSPALSLTLTNTGSTLTTLTSFVITGTNFSEFAQTNTCGSTLAAGANCAINVTFTPSALGPRSATLTITDNAPTSPPQPVILSGNGVNPVPLINQPLAPTSAAPGGPAFTLTVNGTGFDTGATVNWNGAPLATTWVGGEQLTATVPAANIASPGTAAITVANGSTLISNTISLPVTAPTATVTFSKANGSPILVGTAPASIAAGDFNNDGKVDLAVTNFGNNNLTILEGNGDGTFTPAASSPATGAWPYGVALGDFNRDGNLDLAVANAGSNNVTILLGNGNGTFTPAASPATGLEPYALAAGDFNGDGFLDLAVTNLNGNNVTILLGNGDGTFTPVATSPATGSAPIAIAVGDFNGDGRLDLAVANSNGNTVTILLGNGDGTFTPAAASPATGSKPYAVAVGDFNGDGKLDLAVVNFGSNNVTILLGNGDGTFSPAASPATGNGPYAVAVGDFRGDGELDLAVTNENSNTVTILFGKGDGTFTPAASSPATGLNPYAIAVGDFTGDGRLDLATANHGSNNVSVLLQFPVVALFPTSLTFGDQPVGTTSTASSVTVSNTGEAPLIFSSIAVTGDFAVAASGTTCSTSTSVAAGGNCVINVTFTPSAAGARSGDLTLTDNASNSPQVVGLSGTGTVPIVSLSPTSVSFSNQQVGTTSPASTVTVTNNGLAPLTFTAIAVTGNFAIAASGTTCKINTPVAAGSNCAINVTFTPTAATSLSGNLTLTDNAGGSPQSVGLSGTGIAATVSLNPTSLTFGNQQVGSTSAASGVTVTNSGTASLTFTSIAVTGDFAVAVIGTTCSTTAAVAINSNCAINVTFTPSAVGARSGNLTLTDSATGGSQVVGLSGTGIAPIVSLNPTSVSFGSQAETTTSPASAVTVTNNGTAPLAFTSIAVTGDFAVASGTICSTTAPVAASGGSCVINVTFTPTADGTRSGSLTLTDNASTSPQTVSLSGTGTGPTVSLSAAPTFPPEPVGTTSTAQPVTLTNTGNASLTFSAIAVTGPFAIATTGTTCSISTPVAAGGNCTVALTFTPTTGGAASGSLAFTDNAPGSPQTLALSAASQGFTLAPASGQSTTVQVTPGSSATYILSLTGLGGFSGGVSLSCSGAPAGATCSVWPKQISPGTSATNVTVTVSTTATSVSAPRSQPLPPVPPVLPRFRGLLMLALVLAAIAWAIRRRQQSPVRRWQAALFPLALGLLLALAGCGGGGTSGVTPPPVTPVTPAGTYTLTVTGTTGSGSTAMSQTVTLTLIVS
jgi:hypothetical protein